ncbi:MAG: hypothetical protein D3911_14275 [Candidatus Electrothrix sp. AW3_4]|nr:hypothetical protein [Candidatus Electrothrix gigas]
MSRIYLLFCLLILSPPLSYSAEFVWIEAEQPDSTNFTFKSGDWGVSDLLSDQALILTDQSELASFQEEYIRLRYDFTIQADAMYTLWNRIGFEKVRPAFEYRLDQGPWKRILNTKYSVDLYVPRPWNEIAWLELGRNRLQPGRHRLEIRIARQQMNDKGKPRRMLYVSDAFCLINRAWRPFGKVKPGKFQPSSEDLQAEQHRFTLAQAPPGSRSVLELTGLWQYARYDEFGEIRDRTGPAEYPDQDTQLYWQSIHVPGDRNKERVQDDHCHRFLYKTHVDIPAVLKGQTFQMLFTESNAFTTLYVNGRLAAHNTISSTGWTADITEYILPGQVNEILVVQTS